MVELPVTVLLSEWVGLFLARKLVRDYVEVFEEIVENGWTELLASNA